MRTFLFTVLTSLFTISLFATTNFAGGDGSELDPFEIETPEQFKEFADDINNGTDYSGKYFKLTSDIDLNGYPDWTPIGDNINPFNAHFDGDCFTISNLTIDTSNEYVGLFGYINNDGSISNLKLENVNIINNIDNDQYIYIGGLAGYNNGDINNCSVIGTVECNKTVTGACSIYIGGLVGLNHNNGLINNCYATGAVTGTSNGANIAVGGLVGANYYSIENCYTDSNVAGYDSGQISAGGLVGWNNDNGIIKNCYTTGTVINNGNFIGNLAGYNYKGTIEDCYGANPQVGANNAGTVDTRDINELEGNLGSLDPDVWGVIDGELPFLKWAADDHIIIFETNDGSTIEDETVKYGEKITEPFTTREGYTLVGWYKEAEFTNEWDFNTNQVVGDITLYAKWDQIIIKIYHEVNLVKSDSVNLSGKIWGIHEVQHGYDLKFTATIAEDYAGYTLNIYANGERLTPVYGDIYMVENVASDVLVTFILEDNKTANETISAAKVWTSAGNVHITNTTQAEVKIVGINGSIMYAAKTNEATVSLPSGVYIVMVGNEIRKVVVR